MALKRVILKAVEDVQADIPDDGRHTLPKGIPRELVIQDIAKYGMFQHQHKIWMSRSAGKNAREEDTYRYISVSNFSIKIIQHMKDQKRPSYLVEMENEVGQVIPFDCLTDDMSSGTNFKKLVQRFGWFHWTGTQGDFDRLLGYLMSKMGSGNVVPYLGWQKGGWFAFCNAGVNGVVQKYNDYGCVEINGKTYYVPSGNSIYEDNDVKFQNAKMVRLVENDTDWAAWSNQMWEARGEHGMVACLFSVATLFSDWIFPISGGFPLLFFYGEGSTGKGVLVRAIQTLFGDPQPSITLTGKANTDKGKLRMLAEFINLVMFLDEYRNSLPDDMMEMLKQIWDRIPYRRGTIESEYGTENVPIRCTAAVNGNYYPNYDDALLTRFIVIEFLKVVLTDDQRAKERKLKEMIAKGYSGIIVELVTHRKEFEKEFAEHFYKAKDEVSQRIGLKVTADRMISNISVLIGVDKFFRTRMEMPWTSNQLLEYMLKVTLDQEDKRDQGNDVAHFWDCFLKAVKDGKLSEDKSYTIDGDVLSVIWSDVHAEYLQYHVLLYRAGGHSKTTMLDKLKKHPCWKGTNSSKWVGDRKTSVYEFNIKQVGENVDGLLKKHADGDSLKERAVEKMKKKEKETEKAPF